MDNFNKTQNVSGAAATQASGKTQTTTGSKVLNIIGAIIIVLLIPILVINGTLLVKSVMNPDVPADFMGNIPLVSGYNNMTDFDGNDLIIVKELEEGRELNEGDIVCYWYSDGVVIERITEVVNDNGSIRYATKADTAETANPSQISSSQIIGVYEKHIDDIGSFVLFMQTRLGILVCVVLPIFIICLAFVLIDKKRYHDMLKAMQAQQEQMAQNNANNQ